MGRSCHSVGIRLNQGCWALVIDGARRRGKRTTQQADKNSFVESGTDVSEVAGAEAGAGSVDQIVTGIVRGVYEGRFVPGQKLIEGDLTRKFGVGRGTIREALRRLEAEGLVSANLHRGARIRSFDRDEVRDILEINANIIAFAASLAAQRFERNQDLDELRGVVERMTRSYELASLRFIFMRELVKLTKNKELARYLPRLDATIIRTQFRATFTLLNASQDVQAFDGMVKCIMARDADGAARIGREYVAAWGSSIQNLADEHFEI